MCLHVWDNFSLFSFIWGKEIGPNMDPTLVGLGGRQGSKPPLGNPASGKRRLLRRRGARGVGRRRPRFWYRWTEESETNVSMCWRGPKVDHVRIRCYAVDLYLPRSVPTYLRGIILVCFHLFGARKLDPTWIQLSWD